MAQEQMPVQRQEDQFRGCNSPSDKENVTWAVSPGTDFRDPLIFTHRIRFHRQHNQMTALLLTFMLTSFWQEELLP